MPETGTGGTQSGSPSKDDFDLVLGKATDTFDKWQQVPAWVLGAAAILGGAALVAFPKHLTSDQSRNAWAGVIVALFLAVLLSYRSALTLSQGGSQTSGQGAQAKPVDAAVTPPPSTGTPPSTSPTSAPPLATPSSAAPLATPSSAAPPPDPSSGQTTVRRPTPPADSAHTPGV